MTDQTAPLQNLSSWAILWATLLCFIFGANTVAIKISLSGLGVFTTAGIRFGMAALIILAWAIATNQPLKIKKDQIHQLLLITIIFVVQLSLFYMGISKTHASRGTLLANIQPFFVLFLAHFFIPGDRITVRKSVGIIMAFTGVAFVLLDKSGVTSDLKMGDLIILAAAFVWACNGVYTKRLLAEMQPYQVVLYPTLFSAPFFFLGAFLSDEIMVSRLDPEIILAVLYQGLIATSFGFVAWNTLLQKYGAVSMHSFIFIMPIAGVLLGGLVLNEPITLNIVVALLLIVTGILIVNSRPKKEMAVVYPGRNV